MLFCKFLSHLNSSVSDNGSDDSLLLSYCIIDSTTIITNFLFISIIITFLLIALKSYVKHKLSSKSVKFIHKTDLNQCNEQKPIQESENSSLKQLLFIGLILIKLILISELLLIWQLFKRLLVKDLLSTLLSLLTIIIALFITKFSNIRKKYLLQTLLFIYWLLSMFWSLSKFVIICLHNRDNYYQLIRFYITFTSFLFYSLLAFEEFSAILKSVFENFF
jgi:hypothetical protein